MTGLPAPPAGGGVPSTLPSLARLYPPPPADRFRSWLETESRPGDLVLDPWARGGHLARMALDTGRRAISLELSPLTQLLADLLLRPPDLLHLEAAIQAMAGASWGGRTVRAALDEAFASRCPTCGQAVVLEEVIWIRDGAPAGGPGSGEGEERADLVAGPGAASFPASLASPLPGYRPAEKRYRCWRCGPPGRAPRVGRAPLDADDLARATRPVDPSFLQVLADRFSPLAAATGVAGWPVVLHPPRELAGLAALVAAVEGERRAPGVDAALRLALAEAVAAAHPLATAGVPLGVGRRRVRRERHPWLAFLDGYRRVRALVVGLHSHGAAPVAARSATNLAGLLVAAPGEVAAVAADGPLGASPSRPPRVLAGGTVLVGAARPDLEVNLALEASRLGRRPVHLLVGELPPPTGRGRVLVAAHLAAWVLGREAAGAILTEVREAQAGLPAGEGEGEADESAEGVAPGQVRSAAWWQVLRVSRSLARLRPLVASEGRAVLFTGGGTRGLLTAVLAGWRAGYQLEAVQPGGRAGKGTVVLGGWSGNGADRLGEWAAAVADAAHAVLHRRGEPTRWEPLVASVVAELARRGILGGLVREAEAVAAGRGGDPVNRLHRLLASLLGQPASRLREVEPGWWWLATEPALGRLPVPLSDRMEWAVFSLLTTGGPLRPAALAHRLARLFPDDPLDDDLVAATMASYAAVDSETGILIPRDDLAERSRQHARLVALAATLGRRLGLAVSIAPRLRGQTVDGHPLSDWLTADELRRPAGAIAPGAPDALEEVDVVWYRRGRAVFFVEVEWTAMLWEPLIQRHRRIPGDERTVRFLVVLPERVDLVAAKLDRGPLLRRALREGNWHVLRGDRLERLAGLPSVSLADLEPHLGLHPADDQGGIQIPLFAGG